MLEREHARSVRSFLFTPGSEGHRLAKAAASAADVIIVDLEDSVAPAKKAEARAGLAAHAPALRSAGKILTARINSEPEREEDDLAAAAAAMVDAVMIPKAEEPDRIERIIRQLSSLMHTPATVIALVETPRGVRKLDSFLGSPELVGVAFGTEDFAACMGAPPTPSLLDLPCREIAIAAAQYQIAAIGMPYSIARFDDIPAIEAAANLARSYGLTGALCIHPRQVAIVNAAFGVSTERRAWAEKVMVVWARAQADGKGVASLDGTMIDAPVVAMARQVMENSSARS